jgi:hypothetical protein
MLQDSALPLQVKKLKMERNKLRPKKPIPEIVHTIEPQQETPQEEVDDGVQQ